MCPHDSVCFWAEVRGMLAFPCRTQPPGKNITALRFPGGFFGGTRREGSSKCLLLGDASQLGLFFADDGMRAV